MKRDRVLGFTGSGRLLGWLASGSLLALTLFALEAANHAGGSPHGRHAGQWSTEWFFVRFMGRILVLAAIALSIAEAPPHRLRRLFAGLGTLVVAAGGYIGIAWTIAAPASACIEVAGAVYWALSGSVQRRTATRAVAAAAAGLLIAAAYSDGRDTLGEIFSGSFVGWLGHRVAGSRKLAFLDADRPWHALRREISNAWNLFVVNSPRRWEAMYAAGHWDCLRHGAQRPRHYIISSLVLDRFPAGAAVLDVGCGQGVLYPLLRGVGASYHGIDFAKSAIQECVRNFRGDPRCSFEEADITAYQTDRRFDAVVLNEVLYYLSPTSVAPLLRRAAALLRADGIIVVSMGSSPGTRRVWRSIEAIARAENTFNVADAERGANWTIKVFRGAALAPESPSGDLAEP